jgi:hypothetical protein
MQALSLIAPMWVGIPHFKRSLVDGPPQQQLMTPHQLVQACDKGELGLMTLLVGLQHDAAATLLQQQTEQGCVQVPPAFFREFRTMSSRAEGAVVAAVGAARHGAQSGTPQGSARTCAACRVGSTQVVATCSVDG